MKYMEWKLETDLMIVKEDLPTTDPKEAAKFLFKMLLKYMRGEVEDEDITLSGKLSSDAGYEADVSALGDITVEVDYLIHDIDVPLQKPDPANHPDQMSIEGISSVEIKFDNGKPYELSEAGKERIEARKRWTKNFLNSDPQPSK